MGHSSFAGVLLATILPVPRPSLGRLVLQFSFIVAGIFWGRAFSNVVVTDI